MPAFGTKNLLKNHTRFIFQNSARHDILDKFEKISCSNAVSAVNVCINTILYEGRAIAQVVSRRLPISAVRVRFQIRTFRFCCLQNCTGADFLQVLWLQPPILIPPNSPYLPFILGPNFCSLVTDANRQKNSYFIYGNGGYAGACMKQRCITEFLNAESIAPIETHRLIGIWQSM
jgi:hypothetical protein